MIPDIIYLQWFDEDGEKSDEITWCKDRINDSDIVYHRLTKLSARSKNMQCPYCQCPDTEITTEPDENSQAEYHCLECGEYFVALAMAA
jgi:transposase-like protein